MARILVVDDEPGIQRLVAAILRSSGHEVDGALTGAEAVTKVEEDPPDLIVLDLALPDIDGREVYRTLRGRGMHVPTLVLSAYGAALAQRELAADSALSKPFDADDLIDRVEALLGTAASQ